MCIVIKSFFTLAPQPTFQGQQGFQNPPGQQISCPPQQNPGAYPQPGYVPGAPYGQQPYAQPGSGLNTYPNQSGNNTIEYALSLYRLYELVCTFICISDCLGFRFV